MPTQMAVALNCSSTARPTSALHHEEDGGGPRLHLPGGEGARARALHLRVEITVGDIVVGRARPSHGDGADQEQEQMRRVRKRLVTGERRQGGRPPARQEQ